VVVVFQPHLPSRTRALGAEIGAALGAADVVVVTDVYLAREPPDPAATGRDVAARVPGPARVVHAPSLAEAAEAALAEVRAGDLLITMGAGDVTLLGKELVARLEKQSVDGDPDDRSRPA